MPEYQVVLTAKKTGCCPLYKPGDKVVVNLPEVDLTASDKVCAFLLAGLLQKCLGYSPNMLCEKQESFISKDEFMAEFHLEEGTISCPRVSTDVSFDLSIEEKRDESIVAQQQLSGHEGKQQVISQLQKIPVLAVVSADQLYDVLSQIRLKKYPASADIIQKGQPGRNFYIVYDGEVEVFQTEKDGKESIISNLQKGECFGEMSLLTGDPIANTIRTATESSILTMTREAFRTLMDSTPDMRMVINRLMARRIKQTNERMGLVIGSGMVGQLQAIGFPDLVQTLSLTECNGILHVQSKHGDGEMFFLQGQPIDIVIGEESGAECFYTMLNWKEGKFRFEETEFDRPQKIMYGITELLLEGMRRIDEETRKWESKDFNF